ncbi:MAG: 2,3-bisphosphoglycerate-independent phosphoglycerate mutase [Patescibacteria group bacterium]|nr:2,3-bisphosphoglycerate-independent phosphoglycerate mutase [Patescibacteria group bacterium]MDD4304583.1 2,3-bisphosphoglycerate-independent phosphoglycerate mutase [Patescibacteria group bacterium]MDD4695618.1 2,3-bisphosphoglycerate-independent phosphoglycerate mutase [Patescibacteria group bacterium]
MKKTKLALIILDGWGIAKPSKGNAITLANTPNYNYFLKHYPHSQLIAHGEKVGLPKNQDGNSEAGHINIGAGRVVLQDDMYITKSIKDGTFFKNPAFMDAIQHVKKNNSSMHLLGLLSGYQSAHVNPHHISAIFQMLKEKNIKKVYVHLFTDGRDSSQHSAIKFVKELKKGFRNGEKIATVIGRFYAMDRNKKWDRTEKAYDAMVNGKALFAESAEEAIMQAYNRNETDEFITPTAITENGNVITKIRENDSIIFFNLRSDRARQMAKLFVQKNICDRNQNCKINRKRLKNIKFVSMTDFGPDLDDILNAFPSRDIDQTLPMQLRDFRQLYISESEKYAHITYFFNGGYKDPVAGESREMVLSPDVDSYATVPEMSSYKLADKIIKYVKENKYDFYAINFANSDMVGHTGNLSAGIKAIESIDHCLGKLYKAFKSKGFVVIITADHGNIEEMINLKTGEVDTKHSKNPVPFMLINADSKINKLQNGILGNIAPTILDILGLKKPKEMTSKSLLQKNA